MSETSRIFLAMDDAVISPFIQEILGDDGRVINAVARGNLGLSHPV